MSATSTKPVGSTLRKKGYSNNNFKKGTKGGKLNIIAMDVPQYCIADDNGAESLCAPSGGGGRLPIGSPINPENYPVIPEEQTTPVAVTPITEQPQVLPMGEDYPDFQPPYSYAETDAASCKQLAAMISSVKESMAKTKIALQALQVYQKWLAYAEDRYNSNCKIVSTDPVEITPVAAGPTAMVPVAETTPTVDEPPVVKTNQIPVTEPPASPTIDSPEIIQTLNGPSSAPYPQGPSGGGGGSTDEPNNNKNKNWFWVVLAATTITGFLLYSKKSV